MQYLTDKNAINLKEAGLTNQSAIEEWVKGYFKIVQDCGNDSSNCFAKGEYKKMNGTAINIFSSTSVKYYVLANGTAIVLVPNGDFIQIMLDINGKKGPNIVGRDTFAFMLYPDGQIDDFGDGVTQAPLTKEQRDASFNSYCNSGHATTWWGCVGKIINDGWQMTY